MSSKVKLIQIADDEYRLSGFITYMSTEYRHVVVDGETYTKEDRIEKIFDIDQSWATKKQKYYDPTECDKTKQNWLGIVGWRDAQDHEVIDDGIYDEYRHMRYDDWYCHVLEFMDLFDLPRVKVWEPTGWSNSLFRHVYPFTDASSNEYVLMLQSLNYKGAFDKIKGYFWFGKKGIYQKDTFNIIIDHYGFNNRVGFCFDFKDLIKYDLLKLVERMDDYSANQSWPGMHNKLIDKIIKDYYQKTGSIDDSDRVNILANYINSMTA